MTIADQAVGTMSLAINTGAHQHQATATQSIHQETTQNAYALCG
jgi:hypothetical protein